MLRAESSVLVAKQELIRAPDFAQSNQQPCSLQSMRGVHRKMSSRHATANDADARSCSTPATERERRPSATPLSPPKRCFHSQSQEITKTTRSTALISLLSGQSAGRKFYLSARSRVVHNGTGNGPQRHTQFGETAILEQRSRLCGEFRLGPL